MLSLAFKGIMLSVTNKPHYVEYHSTECRLCRVSPNKPIMLSVILLSVVFLSVVAPEPAL